MGAESGMNSSVRDDRVALSDGAKALWGKTNRIDDSEWLPLYVHMVDSAAMASKIWDTWVPQGTKAVIVGDLGNDEVLARKLMIFMAGIHDIGKATPVFQAKSITFGPEAGSFAWKAERAGLPMIAGLRGTNHPTHPIAGEIILEGYLLRVRGWERKAARQYACVVGGHHGTPPDKSKIDEEKNRKTNVGLDSEAWVSTQDELIDFVANIAGIEEKEWEDLSERRFSVQSAVLMTGLVIMADWIASNSDEDMFRKENVMSVLLLQLAGPLQSWGDSSRFVRRETRNEPTKSGVIGMLASAQGRNREDSIEDLLGLSFGVRIEQRGRIIRDLQTEKSMTRKRNSNRFDKEMPLTYRYYLSDARFLVALGAKRELLETLDQAIHTPKWPLFLGRRSCPPDYPLSLGIHDEYADVRQALDSEPWHAAKWYRRRYRQPDLEIVCDAMEGEDTSVQSDLPLSFSSTGRKYADRVVYRYRIPNPDASENVGDNTEKPPSFDSTGEADPMSFI